MDSFRYFTCFNKRTSTTKQQSNVRLYCAAKMKIGSILSWVSPKEKLSGDTFDISCQSTVLIWQTFNNENCPKDLPFEVSVNRKFSPSQSKSKIVARFKLFCNFLNISKIFLLWRCFWRRINRRNESRTEFDVISATSGVFNFSMTVGLTHVLRSWCSSFHQMFAHFQARRTFVCSFVSEINRHSHRNISNLIDDNLFTFIWCLNVPLRLKVDNSLTLSSFIVKGNENSVLNFYALTKYAARYWKTQNVCKL